MSDFKDGRTPNAFTKVFGFPNDHGYSSREEMDSDYRRAATYAHPSEKYGSAELLAALGDLYEIEKQKYAPRTKENPHD